MNARPVAPKNNDPKAWRTYAMELGAWHGRYTPDHCDQCRKYFKSLKEQA